MIKLCLNSGLAWCYEIVLDCNMNDDIMGAIDELYIEHGLPVPTYTWDDVTEEYEFLKDLYVSFDDFLNENFVPVNGGEVYIDSISHILEIDESELIEDIRYDLVSFINLMNPYSIIATELIDLVYELNPEQIQKSIHDFNIPGSFIEYRIWVYEVLENIIELYGEGRILNV